MTKYEVGDRVKYDKLGGTVAKYIPAQGRYVAVCVVEWDDDSRGTIWASNLERESN